jgi:hypothetical protein
MAIPYTYAYSGKIKNVIHQFLRIFTGLQVQAGVDRDNSGTNDFRNVSVHHGSLDRIIAGVLTKHGTFVANTMPIITGYMTNIELDPENRRSKKHVENIVYTKPEDGTKAVKQRVMGTPYLANFDLSIWATTNEEMMQILEQILVIFNPRLTINTSDDVHDWSYLSYVELIGINNEENVPQSTDSRVIIQSLNFQVNFMLNYPRIENDKIIEQINVNIFDNTNTITDIETITIDENT